MNETSAAVAGAATFAWLGMVLAISFLETPLKFRAPGVTAPVGLGIGRIVFRALNLAEVALAAVVVVAIATGGPAPRSVVVLAALVLLVLAVQLAVVRPRLNRSSDRVLAGENPPRSKTHHAYIALEIVKVLMLPVLGGCLLGV